MAPRKLIPFGSGRLKRRTEELGGYRGDLVDLVTAAGEDGPYRMKRWCFSDCQTWNRRMWFFITSDNQERNLLVRPQKFRLDALRLRFFGGDLRESPLRDFQTRLLIGRHIWYEAPLGAYRWDITGEGHAVECSLDLQGPHNCGPVIDSDGSKEANTVSVDLELLGVCSERPNVAAFAVLEGILISSVS